MLYFNALTQGLSELPAADPGLRRQIDEEARARGWPALHRELAAVDPEAAARIHPNDPQRIQRALEVYRLSGIPLSRLCAQSRPPPLPYALARLVLAPGDREALHERIRQRFLDMLDRGFIEEMAALRSRGDLHPDLPSMRAVGYRQVWAYLDGHHDRNTLVERAVIATRQFAKRQFTWLRRETGVAHLASEDPRLLDSALRHCAARLPR
jgi:tRNA dimethylallyltransferase